MNLDSLSYTCVQGPTCVASGFDVSVDGMDITIGNGSTCGISVIGDTFTVQAPASGETCFGVFYDSNGVMYAENDSIAVPHVGHTKFLWFYVDAGDIDLSDKTVYRWLPSS